MSDYHKPLKGGGSRLISRGVGGRFVQTTFSDMGIKECECCGKLFMPDFSKFDGQAEVNPLDFNRERNRKLCGECENKQKEEKEYDKPFQT